MTQQDHHAALASSNPRLAKGRRYRLKNNRTASTAKGSAHPKMPCRLWVCIGFDDETFAELREIAISEKRSMNAVVREIVELGLETRKEGAAP